MKLTVKTTQGGGMFGGGPSSEVSIEGQDYEVAQAVVATRFILAQTGVGDMPDEGHEDETTQATDTGEATDGYFDGDTRDDVPAAGWSDGEKSDERETNPGDAVRLFWPADNSSRVFIDSGTQWVSPAVVGVFPEPMGVEYGDPEVEVTNVWRLGPTLGRDLISEAGSRERIDWDFYVGQVLTTGGGLTVGGVRIEPVPEVTEHTEEAAS